MIGLPRLPVSTLTTLVAFGLFVIGSFADFMVVNGQETETPPHRHIQTLVDSELAGLVSLVGSEDGKFLYGAALGSGKLVTMARDPETGQVEVVDSIGDLKGAVCLAISKDQQWIALTSCQSSLLTLYSRDATTGKLAEVSRRQHAVDNVKGLDFPIAVTISPDSRFVYVTNSGGSGSLTAFEIEDGKLNFLQAHEGVDGCMKDARLLAVDPAGEFLFVACAKANCLVVFDRDLKKGHLRVLHYLPDGTEGCNLLAGAHGVTCSIDGRHLYVASGRFGGDNGITAFEVLQREQLDLVQELEDGEELKAFKAGNHICVSTDGKYVFATGAKSQNILCLERDVDTGRLNYLYDLHVDGETKLGMTAGLYNSKDNRFLYVACEGKKNLYVFERSQVDAGSAGQAEGATSAR
jgi:6-phosphogluconolactonase (cycloisomerase 2 family)